LIFEIDANNRISPVKTLSSLTYIGDAFYIETSANRACTAGICGETHSVKNAVWQFCWEFSDIFVNMQTRQKFSAQARENIGSGNSVRKKTATGSNFLEPMTALRFDR